MKEKRNSKLIFAVLSFAAIIFIIILMAVHQTKQLRQQQDEVIKTAYLASKQNELINYMRLAEISIEHLYSAELDPIEAREEAMRILAKLNFDGGMDGYFFAYTGDGINEAVNLLQPNQPERVGKNEIDRTDASGKHHIKELIDVAKKNGRGFVNYTAIKPSNEVITPKLAYVVAIPEFQSTVIGTGLYLDNVDNVLDKIHKQLSQHIFESVSLLIITALLGLIIIGWQQKRVGEALARFSFTVNLHNKICHRLSRIIRSLKENKTPDVSATKDILSELYETLREVRILMGRKRDINALFDRVREIAASFTNRLFIDLKCEGNETDLLDSTIDALCNIVEEALNNIERFAAAEKVTIYLLGEPTSIKLIIQDNGTGFDLTNIQPPEDSGLYFMKTIISDIGGKLTIASLPNEGTVITVIAPRK
ncbi:putative cache sensor protein [Nitrosomonas sp. Is79A3]|uniref:cache domain-containing protein n=1 Tax=Nitrosomonas sp. (strain Is79A3) TaxID=261292 RepID=UPI000215D280